MTMNEADTRANLIDPKLKEDGWGSVEHSYIRREVIAPGRIIGGGKRSTSVSSDYVLVYKGRKLAAVEAKKESLSHTEGVRQAKDYAERLKCRIAYATNGREIYQIDMLTGEGKLVDDYLSPKALWDLTFAETTEPDYTAYWREAFANIPFEAKGDWQPRYYQENAINAALDAISAGKDRILLTLATGTGKTCIGFQVSWKLFQSRWSLAARKDPALAKKRPRILFLADRNILANQAFNDFGPFGEDAIARLDPVELKKKGVPKNASIFCTIFQTLSCSPNRMVEEEEEGEITVDEDAHFTQYPADFFDLVIIDECHRGGANDESEWRAILDYFAPAVQIGLTATPKRTVNADTYNYFGEPVYSYTLKEGINDGFLTPFKVLPIVGTMDEYVYHPGDGTIVKGEPEQGKVYKESDFNRIITIPEREKKRVHYWMDRFNPKEKTIVFCASQTHAGMVRDFINEYAVQKGWTKNINYCVRVTANDGTSGENDLKIFQDNEKTIPTILTTSRKLSTGVDARNVRNIVLMRPCNNMIEFKQIIGRGTRMYDGKDYFTIYDFVKAHYNFADPEWDGEPMPSETCKQCGVTPCICKPGEAQDCGVCGEKPCICERPEPQPCGDCGCLPCKCEKSEKIEIKLSDGKTRYIKFIASALYWSPEGKLISAREFVERLFDDLPNFFNNEDQLRAIWSEPSTRGKLLADLADAGYDKEKLDSMKALIEAQNSDVYDVLAYVAYAKETKTRIDRAANAKLIIDSRYTNDSQREFIDFVLSHYVKDGVGELAENKIKGLIELKYNTIQDAIQLIGSAGEIRETFIGFQQYLYSESLPVN